MAGIYAEPIQPWKGSLQTVYSPQFAHLQGDYGIRFEVMPAHPGLMGLFTPWENAPEPQAADVSTGSYGDIYRVDP